MENKNKYTTIGLVGPIQIERFNKYLSWENNNESIPSGLGGVPVTDLGIELLNKGFNVVIFTLDREIKESLVLNGENLKIFVGPYRSRARNRALDFFKVEREYLRNTIKDNYTDILHAHWTYEFAIGAISSKRKTLITAHDWAPEIMKLMPDAYRFFRLLMHNYTLKKGDYFTVVSPYIQKSFLKKTAVEYPVIPNMIKDEDFTYLNRKLNKEEPKIVSINNGFDNRKNVKVLIQAFQKIKTRILNCKLILIGTGYEEYGVAKTWAERNKLADGITFLGPQSRKDIFKILSISDVLIHPSKEESFGMTLIEAMSQKTPVIGGIKSGAVPWVLNYGSAGILTNITSSKELGNAAIQILQNEEKWSEYSQKGFSYAYENFSSSKVSEKYIYQYKELSKRKLMENEGV